MSQPPPDRVRVTGPPRRATHTRRPGTGDIDQGTRIGEILVETLVSEQRRLAVRTLTALALTLATLPLFATAWPGLGDHRVVGIPLSYLLLWILVHPWLILLGWLYIRRAEANERAFAQLVTSTERDDPVGEETPRWRR